MGDRVGVERRLLVRIHGRRHPADQEALEVRVLAPEDRVDLDHLALPVERLEVVRDRHQVRLRRQPVGRVPPVGVRERPQLAALHEPLDPIPDAREVLRARERPVRDRLGQRRGLRRVGAQRRDDVDPVEGVQVIEVDDVVLHRLHRDDQIAEEPRVRGRHGANRVLDRPNRRDGVDRRAHAADALREHPGVARIAPLQDQLDAAEHRGGRPGVRHLPAVDLGLDSQVPLDPGDGIHNDVSHYRPPFLASSAAGGAASGSGFWRARLT